MVFSFSDPRRVPGQDVLDKIAENRQAQSFADGWKLFQQGVFQGGSADSLDTSGNRLFNPVFSNTIEGNYISQAYDIANSINSAYERVAQADRDFQQSSAREAMQFEADQAAINRDFQQSSAREAMQFEADQAEINRDWQEQMSNSAYQRFVADLRAAGLNPALAYRQGGAATTSGSVASGYSSAGSSASGRAVSGSKAQVAARELVDMVKQYHNSSTQLASATISSGLNLFRDVLSLLG